MENKEKQNYYLCIDLKSFYASVECVEMGLDPMTTNLVVADPERSEKTICLAISPSMKALGVKNRCRVFEIPKNIKYIMAPPRMQKYIDYAAEIYGVYLQFMSRDDIYVYSIDEVFMDITPYLSTYKKTPREMAIMLMDEVTKRVGVRATAGIGTNPYLAKIALDITAKHSPDFIGELTEESYRKTLWDHEPITDFWRIGRGTAKRLASMGVFNMGQLVKLAAQNEDIFYNQFGIDAELLIDHAWGIEPVTMADIKNYRPETHSLSSGQVLMRDYNFDEGRIVLREMMESMCLDMVAKGLRTKSVTVNIRLAGHVGGVRGATDAYTYYSELEWERGTASVEIPTSSESILCDAVLKLYDSIMDRDLLIRGFLLSCNNVEANDGVEQISFFNMGSDKVKETDQKIQEAMLSIKKKFGGNAIFKSADMQEGATTLERNKQIGGHKSGE